jgi:cell division protein FtsI/penicillin-binding protein 2
VTKAAIPGYSVGGKTGTSQIPVPGGYDPDTTVASFVGFVPVDRPSAVIMVKIDRPDIPRGSDVAAPVFRDIALVVIDELGIPPDRQVTPAGVLR